ncbi:MAG: hypothetical protein ABEK36_01130 [Candidatus Aenigmatarchaeota archaeon]
MGKGNIKWMISIVGIVGLTLLVVFLPRFQAASEMEVTNSASNVYSLVHAYERARFSNRKTFESVLMNASLNLSKKSGGIVWEEKNLGKPNLKKRFKEELVGIIKDNGGIYHLFPEIDAKKGSVRTTIRGDDILESLKIYPDKEMVEIKLNSYKFNKMASSAVREINLESDYAMKVGLPARYFRSFEIARNYWMEILDPENEKVENVMKRLNKDLEEEGFEITRNKDNKGFYSFAVTDKLNNVTYADGYGNFVFNVTDTDLEMPEGCVEIEDFSFKDGDGNEHEICGLRVYFEKSSRSISDIGIERETVPKIDESSEAFPDPSDYENIGEDVICNNFDFLSKQDVGKLKYNLTLWDDRGLSDKIENIVLNTDSCQDGKKFGSCS